MRLNKFLPLLLALLIHALPLAWFLVIKTQDPGLPGGPAGGSSAHPKGIDLSGFSSVRNVRRKTTAQSAHNNEAPATAAGNNAGKSSGTATGNGSGNGIGNGDSMAESFFHFTTDPLYPPLARQKGFEGKVKLRAYYNTEGLITLVELLDSSGNKMLDESAKKALSSWKVRPGTAGSFEKTFQFKLNN